MNRYHAIYGIKWSTKTKQSYTTINGWPNIIGEEIIKIINNNTDEQITDWYQKTVVSEKFQETKLMNSRYELKPPKNKLFVYKYIINLENRSLDFYCHNNIPRAKISFATIRSCKKEEIIKSLQILDHETNYMYNLFDMSA